jgi:hypothetical protein
MQYTFVAAVLDGIIGAEDWRAWLKRKLAERNVRLGDDDEIWIGDAILGPYEHLDVAQAQAELGARPWFSLEPLSPRLGKPVGFFTWTHMGDEELAAAQLVPALMDLARGFIARRDNDEVRHPVALRSYSLDNLVNRHGFYDGDDFLDRSDETLREVAAEAQLALSAAGLSAHVTVMSTHHNPIRLGSELRRDGVVVPDERAALDPLCIHIWAYDWHIPRDMTFWME